MRRYLILGGAALLGCMAAGLYMWASISLEPPLPGKGVPQRNGEFDELAWQTSLIFFCVLYISGALLSYVLGAKEEAEQIKTVARTHMIALNFLGGLWLLSYFWRLNPQSFPGMIPCLGAVLILWVCYESCSLILAARQRVS